MNRLAIIADDQTGAGDSGVHFARAGHDVALILDDSDLTGRLAALNGVSISTDTRFLSGADAARQVAKVIDCCLAAGFSDFFKKIDSTMRGNTGFEIAAALTATGRRAALICPAIPALGRTCVWGELLVDGQPLHLSAMGRDPFHPMTSSTISELLARQIDLPAALLPMEVVRGGAVKLLQHVDDCLSNGVRLLVADAEVQSDLDILARVLKQRSTLLPVGAAGLAQACAAALREQALGEGATELAQGRMLAVVGSLTGISRQQVEHARCRGLVQVLELDVDAAAEDMETEIARLAAAVERSAAPHLALLTGLPRPGREQSLAVGDRVAAMLGQVVSALCNRGSFDILYATGGSTSIGVARALGIETLTLVDELLPGVVLGRCAVPGLPLRWFVSKAGGFGDEQTLTHLAHMFSKS